MDEFERSLIEAEKRLERLQSQADQYAWDITKYFDRINDKLFTLNNIYIAAYLGLIAFKPLTPKSILVIPLINSLIMVFVDYLMMESNRRMSNLMNMTPNQIDKETNRSNTITLIAFLPIVTTLIVTVMLFVYINYYV